MINQAEDLRRRLEAHAQGLPLPPKPTAPAVSGGPSDSPEYAARGKAAARISAGIRGRRETLFLH